MPAKIKRASIFVMLDNFKQRIDSHYYAFENAKIFVANSGGKDSMALTHLLLSLQLPITILHCNFKLRIPDADLDEEFVRTFANKHKIPFHSIQFNTTMESTSLGLTIQETARKLRYDWFKTFIQDNNAILLTAHHLDDNIETFFINLLRGTALKGLSGIPHNSNKICRPLLNFTQSEIEQYVKDNDIDFRQDESNFENKYLRNKLRNSILPSLIEITSDFKDKIQQTIESVHEADLFITKQANAFIQNNFILSTDYVKIERAQILSLDPVLIEYVFRQYGVQRVNRSEFIKFLSSKTGAQFYTNKCDFLVNREQIFLTDKRESTSHSEIISITNLPFTWRDNNYEIRFEKSSQFPKAFMNHSHYVQFSPNLMPLKLRKWQAGDRIIPLGITGSKLISDILIDNKVSKLDKQNTIVILDSKDTMLSLIGFCSANQVKLTPKTKEYIIITWSKLTK